MRIISNNLIKLSFILLTLLIIISPVFFASNRPLYWLSCCIVIGVLSSLFFIHKLYKNEKLPVDTKYIRLAFVAYSAVLVWVLIQSVPLIITDSMAPYWHSMYSIIEVKSPLLSSISLEPLQTIDGLIRWVSYGLVFFVSLQFCRSAENANIVTHTILVSSALCASYGLIMYITGSNNVLWIEKYQYRGDITGTFINRNSFATYIGISLIISVHYFIDRFVKDTKYLQGKHLLRKLFKNFYSKSLVYFLLTGLFFVTLLLTHSRAGLLCSLLGVASCLLVYSKHLIKNSHPFALILPSLIALVAFAWMFSFLGSGVSDRFAVLASDIRPEIYRVTWNAIESNFLLGTGLGTFDDIWNVYRDAVFPSSFILAVQHAHNSYLESMLELGILAFSLLLCSILLLVIQCLKGALTRKRNSRYSCMVFAISVLIWSHALVDFSIEMPAVAIVYSILLGVGVAQSWSDRKSTSVEMSLGSSSKHWAFAMMSILLVVSSIGLLPNAIADAKLENAIDKLYSKKDISEDELKSLSNITEDKILITGNTYRKAAYMQYILISQDNVSESKKKEYAKQHLNLLKQALYQKPLDNKTWQNLIYQKYNNSDLLPRINGADLLYHSTLLLPYRTDSILFILPYLPLYWFSYTQLQQEFFLQQLRYVWHNIWDKHGVFKKLNNPLGHIILYNALKESDKEVVILEGYIKRFGIK